jgi:hypothetical protein
MILYLDAAGLLARYASDQRSLEVRRWTSGADLVATSLVSLAEAAAALAATPRWSGPSRAELKRGFAALEGDWADYVVSRRTSALPFRSRGDEA